MCGVEVPFGFSYVPTIQIGGGGGGGGSGVGYVEKLMWCTLLCELEHMALTPWEIKDENSTTAFVYKFFKLAGPKITTCCGSLRFMGL